MASNLEPRSCPQCKLLCPPSANVCDCGHDFVASAMRELTMTGARARPDSHRIVQIARSYRSLLLFFAGMWLMQGGVRALTGPPAVIGGLILLALGVGILVMTYRLADNLDLIAPLWALGIFVPLINLVLLLMLSSRATKACRDAGMSVGFLGPSSTAIEDFVRSQRRA